MTRKKLLYYIFKFILPDLFLSLLLILLFNILNMGVIINNPINAIIFSFVFTIFDFAIICTVDTIEMIKLKKMLMNVDAIPNPKMMLVFPLINIIVNLQAVLLFYFISLIFKNNIIFEKSYIVLIIGALILLSRFILNKLFTFEKILFVPNQNNEINERFEKMMKELEKNDKITEEEKKEELVNHIEDMFNQIIEEEERKEHDEKED